MQASAAKRWKPNWPLILVSIAVVAVLVFAVRWWHGKQLGETTERILARAEAAEQAAEEAKAQGDRETYAKQLSEAVRNYDEYLRMRPGDSQVRVRLALAVYAQFLNSPDNAQLAHNAYQTLRIAANKVPDNEDVLEGLADLAVRLRIWDAAEGYLDTLLERRPDDPKLRLNRARCHLALARETEAVAELQEVIRRRPDCLEAYVLLAQTYRSEALRDTESAEAVIDAMVANNADVPAALTQRAAYYVWVAETTSIPQERKQALIRARADYEAASKSGLGHDLETILVGFALALHEGDLEKASTLLAEARKNAQNDQRVLTAELKLGEETGDHDLVATALSKLADRDPKHLIDLAEVYLQRRPPDLEAANDVLDRMRQAGFERTVLEFWTAKIAAARGEIDTAIQTYERLWLQSVQNPHLRLEVGRGLAECHARRGWWDRALGIYEVLLRDHPSSLLLRANHALALYHLNRFEAALRELDDLAATQGESWLVRQPALAGARLRCLAAAVGRRPLDATLRKRFGEIYRQVEKAGSVPPVRLRILHAEYLAALGEVDKALADLDAESSDAQASGTASDDSKALLPIAKAKILCAAGRVDEAFDVLEAGKAEADDSAAFLRAEISATAYLDPSQAEERLAHIERSLQELDDTVQADLLRLTAAAYLRAGDLDAAKTCWERVATLDPQDIETRRLLLELAREQGDIEAIERRAQEIADLAGESSAAAAYAEAVRSLALAQRADSPAARNEHVSRAREMLERVEKLQPGWNETRRLQGDCALLTGDLEEAVRLYGEVYSQGLLSGRMVERLVRLLFVLGRFDEARSILASLPEQRLSSGMKKIDAELLLRSGAPQAAVETAKTSLGDSPAPIELLWYGRLTARVGRLDESIDAFRRLVDLAPDWPDAWAGLIGVLAQAGNRDEASAALEKAEAHLNDIALDRVRAVAWEILGNPREAAAAYDRLLKQSPDDVTLLRRAAAFDMRRGAVDDAQTKLRRAFQLAERESDHGTLIRAVRRELAAALAASNDYRAFQQSRSLIEANLNEETTDIDRIVLARLLAGRPERRFRNEAVELYETIRRRLGGLPAEDRFRLAVLYDELNRWGDCRVEMIALLETDPQNPLYLTTFCRRLIEHNAPKEEITPRLEALRKLQPNNPSTTALEVRLAVRDGDRNRAVALLDDLIASTDESRKLSVLAACADLAEQLELYDAAERYLRRAAESQPQAALSLAAFLGRRGRTEEALDLCDTLKESIPLPLLLKTVVGTVKYTRQIPEPIAERIEAYLAEAKEKLPGDKVVPLQEANFYHHLGEYDRLVPLYREILKRDDLTPLELATVQNNMAYALVVTDGGADEARTLIERAIDHLGPSGDLCDTLALVQIRQGAYADAVVTARRALSEAESTLARFHLIHALWLSGDKVAAAAELDAAREDPRFDVGEIPPPERDAFESLIRQIEAADFDESSAESAPK
ncbi:hypothetical protein JCM19992_30610 [Thermostilla marina]